MLELVLNSLRRSKVDEVVIVLGADAEKVRTKVRFEHEKIVFNPEYAMGMSASIRAGLGSVSDKADAALIMLGDQPFVLPETVNKIVEAYLRSTPLVVVPTFHGVRGNPVLFDRKIFPQIMRIQGDVGAKSVVELQSRRLLEVEVEDEGIITDVDTPSEYRELTTGRSKSRRK